jgi:hypothetical protein
MRVDPHLDEVVNGERGMLRGIEVMLEEQCLMSAVALIFSTIDSLSALDRPVEAQSTCREVFIKWANEYLLKPNLLHCTAIDLYAARCGVLHTYSAESDLTRIGKAKKLIYEWRSGPDAGTAVPIPEEAVIIQVEVLHHSLREGVRRFLKDAEMKDGTRSRVTHHLPWLLCYKPWPNLSVQVGA